MDYKIEHWTSSCSAVGSRKDDAITISVNNRAAIRKAIINALSREGYKLIERSDWHAKPPRGTLRESQWDYSDIVLHHAGRSYSCGAPSIDEMQRLQAEDMGRSPPFDDAGYHYAVSCQGEIYEARDIRFIGEHIDKGNTGKIGVVFLSDFVQAGEAYEQEYKGLSFVDKVKNLKDIATDQVVTRHDKPTPPQIRAVEILCETLKEFFNITYLVGLAESREAKHRVRIGADKGLRNSQFQYEIGLSSGSEKRR
ncbi:peptidoglycan recognition protein family protein [Caballeronia catudaia]|nr:peptidoglycan recognition family protein [Caballeronia catudaia]